MVKILYLRQLQAKAEITVGFQNDLCYNLRYVNTALVVFLISLNKKG
jgi:hypothetical protein